MVQQDDVSGYLIQGQEGQSRISGASLMTLEA